MTKYLPLIIGAIVSVTLTMTGYAATGGLFLLAGLLAPAAFPRDEHEDDLEDMEDMKHQLELMEQYKAEQNDLNMKRDFEQAIVNNLVRSTKLRVDFIENNVNSSSQPFGG